jgi:hypothetical protein
MCPSVYATQLAPAIAPALKSLNQELTPQPVFDVASSTDCFRLLLRISPHFVFSGLMNRLQETAPGLRLSCVIYRIARR